MTTPYRTLSAPVVFICLLVTLLSCAPSAGSAGSAEDSNGYKLSGVEFDVSSSSASESLFMPEASEGSRPFDYEAFDSLEDPKDPRPDGADSIRALLQRWTGVALPKSAEKLSYTHELKAHRGEARHHLSFLVSKELGAELLQEITSQENVRFHKVRRPDEDIEIIVEPSTGDSLKLARDTSYWIQLQPRWARDDELYVVIDLETGQVYCHRWDD